MQTTRVVLATICTILCTVQPGLPRDLRDLLPGLYGGNGITLAPASGHAPHFTVDTASSIDRLNTQIAGEVGVFPFTSSLGGFTFALDPVQGTFVRTTRTLGPLFAERASTLGRGKINLNAAYTFFSLNTFEGESLSNLRVTARHQADALGDPNAREGFELDNISVALDLALRVRIFSLAATYGVTDRLDIGVLVPLVNVNMRVRSNARIITSEQNSTPEVHTFAGGPDSPIDEANGSATGLGDIVVRAKYHLYDTPWVDVAGALLARVGTGDAANFLGTGTTSVRPFLVLSKTFFDVFTPHLNIGYDFNLDQGNRSALEYAVGFDVGSEQFTIAFDFLARHRFKNQGVGGNILTASLGGKWNPFKQFSLFFNAQIPLNEEGLRSNLITTFGADYSF